MPVQTRRRGRSAGPKETAAAAAAATAPAAKKAKQETKQEATRGRSKSPAKEAKKKTNAKSSRAASPSGKKPFDQVLHQIVNLGPTRIQKTLKTRQQRNKAKLGSKQASERLSKRHVISQELHRLSNADLLSSGQVQRPAEIKARAKAEQKRRDAGEKVKKQLLLQEIKRHGEEGLHQVLKNQGNRRQRPAKGVGRRPSGELDLKSLKRRTMEELTTMVSPKTAYHPSLIKQKLGVKAARRQVELEMLKRAQVQEIKKRGGAGK